MKLVISRDVNLDETSMIQSYLKTSVDITQVPKRSFQEVEFEKIAFTTPMLVLIEQEVNEGQEDEEDALLQEKARKT